MSTARELINYGANHKLSKALRDTSSRALFDISAQCPRGSFGAVPSCLAEKSDVLGQIACDDEQDASAYGKLPAVAPAELLHKWICCSSRMQAGEIDCESTETLAVFLNVRILLHNILSVHLDLGYTFLCVVSEEGCKIVST